jgi:hypothetical protein
MYFMFLLFILFPLNLQNKCQEREGDKIRICRMNRKKDAGDWKNSCG